jgi:uncharacterized protein DUF6992
MWADTLLLAERGHLVRLAMWALASIVAGTGVLAGLSWRRVVSPLLTGFAIQQVAWGVLDLARVAVGIYGLRLRDFAAATRLDRFIWLDAGLDIGLVVAGIAMVATTWFVARGRRLGGVGAGLGIIVQGAALFALDARFLVQLTGFV